MPAAAFSNEHTGVRLRLEPAIQMTEEQFFDFCQQNPDLRIERTPQNELVIMSPTGGWTGNRNIRIAAQVQLWADKNGTGMAFDSSTGFNLPNGGTRSPDAAWVRRERLAELSAEEKERFLPLCPDFAVELRSPSDALEALQQKMEEYLANGLRLGWLIDPIERVVYVYRPNFSTECLEAPATLSGDPVLPGFTLELGAIWNPSF